MAKYSNTVEYNIRTTLDNSGIAKLQSELTQLQNKVNTMGAKGLMPDSAVNKTLADIKTVQAALTSAFNPKLGMLNTSKFMSELKAAGLSMNKIYNSFSQVGAAGQRAFTSMYGQISKIDTGLRSVSKTTDKIMNTFGNTFRWGIIASAFAGIMNSVHQAAQYTQDLDKSLTNIMMVSGETRENMNEYARTANEVAQKLGSTTVAMTDATQVFIQQGYDLQKSQQLAEYSTILGNVSQQDTKTASDEITAYMNAYEIPLENIGNALSKWAEVANVSAADVEELSVASQKAASVATTVGVDMDQLAATIATIETVTREAPENIGNGLKTIYSRLSDVKLGETLEDGVDLGQITSALSKVGVQVLDDAGKMRDVGVIVEDLMSVWDTLDQTEKAATATTLAGRFQLARFEALMNRSDLYREYLGASREQTGTETLDSMQSTYEQSLEGRLNTLQSKIEEVFLNIFNSNSFNGAVDALSGLVDALNEVIKATGGGETALLGLSTVLLNLASNNLSRGISNFIVNRQSEIEGQKNIEIQQNLAKQQLQNQGLNTGNEQLDRFATDIARVNQYSGSLNEEQMQIFNNLIQERVQILNDLSVATEKQSNAEQILRLALEEEGQTGQMTTEVLIAKAQALIDDDAALDNVSNAAKLLTENLNGLINSFEKNRDNELTLIVNSKKLSEELTLLKDSGVLTEKQMIEVSASLELLNKAANGDVSSIERLSTGALREMAEALEFDERQVRQLVQHLEHFRGQVAASGAAADVAAGQMEHFGHGVELQNTTNQLIGLVSGIGQLAFAWQSFQHLGSLWADNDIETGEKVLQTVINVSFALPMLITGLQGMAAGWEVAVAAIKNFNVMEKISALTTSLRVKLLGEETAATMANTVSRRIAASADLAEAGAKKSLNAISLMTIAMKNKLTLADTASIAVKMGLISAETAEIIATRGLAAALRGLLVAALPIAAPFIAATAAIAAFAIPIGIAMKEAEEARKQFEENLTASNGIVDTINSQKDSYDELYKKYEETGEVSDELKEKAVSLGDALGVQGAQVLADAGNFDELNKKIQEATILQLQYNEALLSQKRAELSGSIESDRRQGEFTTDEYGNTYIDYSQDTRSNAQILGANQNQFNEYQKQIQQAQIELIQARAEGKDTSEIDQRIKQYQEEAKAIQLTAKELEYLNTLKQENDSDFAAKLESEAFDGLNFRDETGKADLSQYQDFLLQDEDIKEYYDYLFEAAGKETADAYINSLISQISDRLPLDLQEALKEALNAANNATKEKSSYQSSVLSRQEQIQKDAGIEGPEAFDQYQQQFIAVGGAGISQDEINTIKEYHDQTLSSIDSQKELVKNLEKEKDNLRDVDGKIDESSEAYKDWQKRIKEANNDLSKLAKDEKDQKEILDGLTLAAMETNTGLQELSDGWSKWNEALTSGDLNEQSVALAGLQSSMEKILNVSPGTLPTSFIKDHLEEISALAQGDLSVLDDLRIAASETIVQKVVLEDENFKGDVDELTNYVHQAQALLPELEVGATVDDAEFIAGLESMLQNAQITEQSLGAIFEAMGYDVQIDYETASLPSFEWNAVSTGNSIIDAVMNGAGGLIGKVTGAISGSIPIRVPRINFTKKGGGSSPALGSRGGGGGKGGGGGGGGGGSKAKSVEKAEGAESDDDIYNKVNSKLEELADNYTEIDKAKGRAYGDKYRKAAEKEISNLQKQNALLRERNKISEAKKQALISGQDNPDYGIYLKGESLAKYGLTDVDNDGTIDNYIQKYNEALAKQNAAQKAADDYWNSLGGEMNEDQQEHYKKLQEAQKDAADYANKILDVTNEYQEVCDKIRDDTEQILENEHEMEDIAIDLFQTATKTVDTLKDLNESKGWLQGLFTNRESDSPFRALVEDLNLLEGLFGTTTTNANLFFKTMIDGAKDAASKQFWTDARDQAQNKFGNGTSILDMRQFYLEKLLSQEGRNIYGSNEKQYYEDLQDLYNDIIGDMKDVESKYEDVLDDIIDAYDELADRMEFRNEQLEYELNFLEHQRDMIELIHGDESYDMFGIINQAQVEGTLQKVNEAKLQYDYWVRERDKYNKETQKELWEEMDKKAREFGEALTDATKEAADAMAKQYEDATEAVIQHFRDELFGGTLGDAGFFEKEWEMANDQAEQYLDNVERGMELEKLRGRVQKIQDDVIDATDQKYADRAKAILKALEDQKKAIINNQGELEYVNALSQFDVDLANAKIEALQKQIALEEAQRNKNQMQLRRDTQGNYRYVYRANQDDILSAQEELADSEYEIYEMSKERYSDLLNERWQVQQEYEDRVRFANERYADDQEKLAKALNEIQEWYTERQVNLGLELKDAQEGMIDGVKHLAEDTSDYVSQMFTDIADSMQENWADACEEIGVIYSAELHNLTEDTNKFRERVQQAQDETITAAETFDDKLRVLEDTAETSFSNIDEIINDVTKDMSSLNESTEEFMRIIRGDTGEIDDATLALERYQKQIESLQNSSSALASALRQAQNELDSKTRESANYKTQIEKVSKGDGYFDKDGVYHDNPKSTSSSSNNNGYTDSQIAWGIAQNIWTYGNTAKGGWGNDPDRRSRITAKYGESIANLTQQYINEYASTGDLVNWGSDIWGYATGGYTGTWVDGSKDAEGGRLALLHQKELVLNPQDTENLLGAVDIVRQIINNMKNIDALNMPSMFGVNSNIGDSIEQRVEIVAEFPNVDTAEDIREALLSLADNAFQYAYKTR